MALLPDDPLGMAEVQLNRRGAGKRWQVLAAAGIVMLMTALPGQALEHYPAEDMLYEHAMPPACAMAEYLGYEKIDGEWVGGRSVFRGELPVVGPVSKLLVDSTLARSGFFRFDAQGFRFQKHRLDSVAKVFNINVLPNADLMSGEIMIDYIDETVERLLKYWDGPDPWTLCDEVEARRREEMKRVFEELESRRRR